MNQNPTDAHWMAMAIEEAAKGVGRTAPNPPVGAVITKNGVLIGRGWHRAAGQPHAEREAIADVMRHHGGDALRGATIYVTLEPCSTHGRTPPCTAGIVEAGITRVVYACRDENPAHSGRADRILGDAGIEVCAGVSSALALDLLRPFFKTRDSGLPWVIWKTAMSIDGRLTRPPGEGQWLTSEASRLDVQHLRAGVDAIITSGQTVRCDRPSLTIRVPELISGRRQPLRVVFTADHKSLPQDAPLFDDPDRVVVMGRDNLATSLKALVARHGVLSAMIEAGGTLPAAFLAEGLIDEVVAYMAPMLCGGPVASLQDPAPARPPRLVDARFDRITGSGDIRMRARFLK